ncbi:MULTISPECIES: class I SAM-dependent methyltransferase [Burkholderia]|uniref:class I SAM-dependent methyltransferase n=1 Tax=Burkholderia TaxID=32008 RepID=UPI00075E9331|nr:MULTISPECIES: methyltransferase domain-containing protein [Burkholderia]AOJ71000.1 methyltransferase [Burkholderia savannae]KVG47607.1 methyltransferase [Burkholderia sp. MSMB0265]KVG82559.1 methyltransferase [Burkholderia sp. MSMB2040]KVG92801.1 methyltransferase [Burkholderia sp. MSMB2041]KVG98662.1 methyltransferase [Burkholderia sp. MSMB2042]
MKKPAHYQTLEYERIMVLMRAFQHASSRPLRVLDYGCGLGKFLDGFAALGLDVTGVDTNPDYVARARAKGYAAYEPDAFLASQQQPFDVIFLSHVIEHVSPDGLVTLVPRLCAFMHDASRMILVSPTPGERFYHDFSHVRPYLPQSIRHAFGTTGMPISFGEAGLLEMVDVYFFKDPYRTRLWRSFYTGPPLKRALTRGYNRLLDIAWRASGGRVGVIASWLGVYVLRSR